MSISFFSNKDLHIVDGGLVRIKGILSSCSESTEVLFYCTSDRDSYCNSSVLNVGKPISKNVRRLLYICYVILPFFIFRLAFLPFLYKFFFNFKSKYESTGSDIIIGFEYFDNFILHIFKRLNLISNYITDVHGIAPYEFSHKHSSSFIGLLINRVRYYFTCYIDSAVFSEAYKIIVFNKSMASYFVHNHTRDESDFIYLDDSVSSVFLTNIDSLVSNSNLTDLNISHTDKVFLFIGSFKSSGGVFDLVQAFYNSFKNDLDAKLILVGGGEDMCLINEFLDDKLARNIIFVGTVPYEDIFSFYAISDFIVCPDIDHPYNRMITHTKMYEALASGKHVVFPNFDHIQVLQHKWPTIHTFTPSSIQSLSHTLSFLKNNSNKLHPINYSLLSKLRYEISYSYRILGFLNSFFHLR